MAGGGGIAAMRAVHSLLGNIGSMSDGQATMKSWDVESCQRIVVEISPKGGLYESGRFVFEIALDESYPLNPPRVTCKSNIYHPNIDPTEVEDNVCLNILDHGEWLPALGLEGCIQGLLFLFQEPNLDDPLSPFFDPLMEEEEFAEKVVKSLNGEEIEGVTFTGTMDNKCDIFTSSLNSCETLELSKITSELEVGDNKVEKTANEVNLEASPIISNSDIMNPLSNVLQELRVNLSLAEIYIPKEKSDCIAGKIPDIFIYDFLRKIACWSVFVLKNIADNDLNSMVADPMPYAEVSFLLKVTINYLAKKAAVTH